jgi:hypothetical protein
MTDLALYPLSELLDEVARRSFAMVCLVAHHEEGDSIVNGDHRISIVCEGSQWQQAGLIRLLQNRSDGRLMDLINSRVDPSGPETPTV